MQEAHAVAGWLFTKFEMVTDGQRIGSPDSGKGKPTTSPTTSISRKKQSIPAAAEPLSGGAGVGRFCSWARIVGNLESIRVIPYMSKDWT